MTETPVYGTAKRIKTTYDEVQHCTALREPDGLEVAMDCPYTGKGEEFSPTNLVEAALGGCMLMAMGAFATRHEINLSGAEIAVGITPTERLRFGAIDILVTMPEGIAAEDRVTLERAAEQCPIKHSFDPEIPVSLRYEYTGDLAPQNESRSNNSI